MFFYLLHVWLGSQRELDDGIVISFSWGYSYKDIWVVSRASILGYQKVSDVSVFIFCVCGHLSALLLCLQNLFFGFYFGRGRGFLLHFQCDIHFKDTIFLIHKTCKHFNMKIRQVPFRNIFYSKHIYILYISLLLFV